MQKLILSLLLIGQLSTVAFSQNSASKADDMGRIVLSGILSSKLTDVPETAKGQLLNKLNQIATQNGMGGNAANPRFIITANVVTLSKDITATAPPMIVLNLEVTFYIGDFQTKTKFSSFTVETKGVGTNDTKAYIEALKNINTQNPNLRQFVDNGKTKIMEYYNSQCDLILKEAQTLTAQNKYEEAILKLTSIPDVCKSCYDKAMDATGPIYLKFMEKNCVKMLADARMAFAGSPNYAGAQSARESLSKIDPDAACFKDAQVLTDSIKTKIMQNEKRDWDFVMKATDNAVEMEKQRIQAYKEVGVAYGNNQPKTQITNNDPKDWLF